jgi:hypothetical protein
VSRLNAPIPKTLWERLRRAGLIEPGTWVPRA